MISHAPWFQLYLLHYPRSSPPFSASIFLSFGENWHWVTEFSIVLNGEKWDLVRKAKMSLKKVITSNCFLEKWNQTLDREERYLWVLSLSKVSFHSHRGWWKEKWVWKVTVLVSIFFWRNLQILQIINPLSTIQTWLWSVKNYQEKWTKLNSTAQLLGWWSKEM